MMEFSSSLFVLLRKELRQVRRSRTAILSSILLPVTMLVLMPLAQLSALEAAGPEQIPPQFQNVSVPGLADFTEPTQMFLRFLFPMFVTLGGLLVPSVAATYTIIAERERRSLDLLMALPVRVTDILAAKVLAMLTLALGVVLPLFTLDTVVLMVIGLATPAYIGSMLLLLLSAMTYSLCVALLLALLARDFRTANNLNGALLGPLILVTIGSLIIVPGDLRFFVLAGLLLLGAGLALMTALRWLTFERYLA